jgi:type VI protein secretion system component VasF
MASSASDGSLPTPARSVSDLPLHRRIQFWGFASLFLLGIAFYLWWGFTFDVWIDNGVYAVVSVLVLFGLAGMWLTTPNPPLTAPAAPSRP